MKSYWRALSEAAKNIRNPTEPNIGGLPRQTSPSIQLGEVTQVDVGRKVLGLRFNDPNGTEVTTGVPWLQTFTDDRPPAVGDSVQMFYVGGQVQVFGRREEADDTVTFD